jgi:hypothetical protein
MQQQQQQQQQQFSPTGQGGIMQQVMLANHGTKGLYK